VQDKHNPFTTHPALPLPAGVDWRQKLENQRGAVLATELKNNANKIAKWTAAALVR
jgi:translation initiation factor 3 subunit D